MNSTKMKSAIAAATLAATAVLGAWMAEPVKAQAVAETDMRVVLPSLLILYYDGEITLDVQATDIFGVAGPDVTVDEGNVTITGLTGDAGVDGSPTGLSIADLSAVPVDITNFWGVKAIGNPGGGNITVSVAITTPTLTNADGDTLSMSGISTTNGSFAPPGVGNASLVNGDVDFTLDLSNALTSGTYTGGVIEITATRL